MEIGFNIFHYINVQNANYIESYSKMLIPSFISGDMQLNNSISSSSYSYLKALYMRDLTNIFINNQLQQ